MSTVRRVAPLNRLLATLPHRDSQRLLAACEAVTLKFGEILCEPDERIGHVYFPTDSFVSLMIPVDATSSLEVGLVGNEGMVGSPLILGVNVSPLRALVQGAGPAWRMTAAAFTRELGRCPALRRTLNRYLQVQMHQLAQTAACTSLPLRRGTPRPLAADDARPRAHGRVPCDARVPRPAAA